MAALVFLVYRILFRHDDLLVLRNTGRLPVRAGKSGEGEVRAFITVGPRVAAAFSSEFVPGNLGQVMPAVVARMAGHDVQFLK